MKYLKEYDDYQLKYISELTKKYYRKKAQSEYTKNI